MSQNIVHQRWCSFSIAAAAAVAIADVAAAVVAAIDVAIAAAAIAILADSLAVAEGRFVHTLNLTECDLQ